MDVAGLQRGGVRLLSVCPADRGRVDSQPPLRAGLHRLPPVRPGDRAQVGGAGDLRRPGVLESGAKSGVGGRARQLRERRPAVRNGGVALGDWAWLTPGDALQRTHLRSARIIHLVAPVWTKLIPLPIEDSSALGALAEKPKTWSEASISSCRTSSRMSSSSTEPRAATGARRSSSTSGSRSSP